MWLFSFRWKKYFWTKPITKKWATSLETLCCQEYSNESESNTISTIDIVVDSDHSEGKFRLFYKFVLRDMNVKNIDSYAIKNTHIGYDKDTYDVLNNSIIKPLNDQMKIIMNEDMLIYFMWKED